MIVILECECIFLCQLAKHWYRSDPSSCFLLSGRHDEALAIAERGRTRAFADLLVERQKGSQQAASADPYTPVTVEHILETVNSQRAVVLYYSLAGGFLYSWLISPGTGAPPCTLTLFHTQPVFSFRHRSQVRSEYTVFDIFVTLAIS